MKRSWMGYRLGCAVLGISMASAAPVVYPESRPDSANPVERGWRALAEGRSDSARYFFLGAHRLGLPRDSLCFLLAETALRNAAYDTALVFNLCIAPDGTGAFHKNVVEQRLRIYSAAGMKKEFERLRDSSVPAPGIRREKKWSVDLSAASGYGAERYFPVRQYPFSEDLGGMESGGWVATTHAGLSRSMPEPVPMRLRLGFDVGKTYYKDSLDLGVSATARVGKPEKGPSAGLTLASRSVTSAGNTGSGKADAAYLLPHRHGLWMIQAGFEGEWVMGDSRRYDVFWVTIYADQQLPFGSLSLGFTASLLGQASLLQENSMPVIYVDDPAKSAPVHFRNPSFRDTLTDSTAAATYALITGSAGNQAVSMTAPQNVRVFAPALAYSFPLPFGFSGEAGGRTEFLIYPQPYAWEEAPLPASFQSGDFQALAMSRIDRELYAAVLRLENGVMSEFYSTGPLARREANRRDIHWRAQAALWRPMAGWGRLGLEGYFGNTRSSLSKSAPIWIPSWESGLSMSWTSTW